MEPLTLSQILEAGFGLLGAAIAIAVLILALRIAPTLTLFSHQHSLRIFVGAALLIVAAELIGVLGPLFRASTFTDIVEELAELFAISSGALVLYLLGKAEREEVALLRRLAEVDDLTDLSTRSFFRRAAARRIELSKKNDLPLTCAVLDVDDFKLYNDRYGHRGGDEALRCIARVLRRSVRADDLVARYGGEEFVLLISGEMEGTVETAERIRQEIESECIPASDASLGGPVTVSLGIAPLTKGTQTLVQLIEAADKQMYRAKQAGKNQVFFVDHL